LQSFNAGSLLKAFTRITIASSVETGRILSASSTLTTDGMSTTLKEVSVGTIGSSDEEEACNYFLDVVLKDSTNREP
jgi:hypothetical protein